jgi:preprotein translocase subunit YajC
MMTNVMTSISVPFVLAVQGAPQQPSLLVQLFPFALMLGIFYLLVLMPMRKRQRKVQEFQAGLKVGDKSSTTGASSRRTSRSAME